MTKQIDFDSITVNTPLKNVMRMRLAKQEVFDLELRLNGWYYDNRGNIWKLVAGDDKQGYIAFGRHNDLDNKMINFQVILSKGIISIFTFKVILDYEGHKGAFTKDWYLVAPVPKTAGTDILKTLLMTKTDWNEKIVSLSKTFSSLKWGRAYYLGPNNMISPQNVAQYVKGESNDR